MRDRRSSLMPIPVTSSLTAPRSLVFSDPDSSPPSPCVMLSVNLMLAAAPWDTSIRGRLICCSSIFAPGTSWISKVPRPSTVEVASVPSADSLSYTVTEIVGRLDCHDEA